MRNELLGSGNSQGRLLAPYSADDMDLSASRRVSAASDDSFDASSYVHVDNKLNNNMPKCLFGCYTSEKPMENHFTKTGIAPAGSSITKSGKRVIRKRLSMSEFKAKLKANINNNSNVSPRKLEKIEGDVLNSSSSDNDTLPKTKKRSTDVLSAKIQHLLFEMKRLRQMDRDILRQFLIINDTIEEQKWMMEEKQEAIKRSLSEEGEDPDNFDSVQEAADSTAVNEESTSHNSSTNNSPCKDVRITKNNPQIVGKDSDLVSTSSDSALSMTGGSSTLSSTTSLPVSNRSTSPSTSNLSTTSASSSYVDSTEAKMKANDLISTARTEPTRRFEHEVEGDDVESYFRMNGHVMKRGSYPFPRQSQSFDVGYAGRARNYDDNTLDSAYSTRRGSTDSDSRDAAESSMAVRRGIANRSYAIPQRTDGYQSKPMARSNSVREANDIRNRVTRISVRPDDIVDEHGRRNGVRRVRSVNERTLSERQFHNSVTQRQLAKLNITRQVASFSFVPIAEQQPDLTLENGRFYSPGQNNRSQSKTRRENTRHINPPPGLQLTMPNHRSVSVDSSRASPLSPPRSSSSNSSVLSQSNYVINEADQYRSHSSKSKEPVWVPQFPGSVKANNHYGGGAHHYQNLLSQSYSFHRNHIDANYADTYYEKGRAKYSQRPSNTNCAPEYHENFENNRVLQMSRSASNSRCSAQAVYQWIQAQDDITYL